MERAFNLDTSDARILMELDQLYKRMGRNHAVRLTFIEQYPELIGQRDDLLLECITLHNQTGDYHRAMTMLDGHIFHPWEGGEGKVSGQYQLARTELAKQALTAKDYPRAIVLLGECLEYHTIWARANCVVRRRMTSIILWVALTTDWVTLTRRTNAGCMPPGGRKNRRRQCINDAKPDKIFYREWLLKLGASMRLTDGSTKTHQLWQEPSIRRWLWTISQCLPDLQIWEGDLDMWQ